VGLEDAADLMTDFEQALGYRLVHSLVVRIKFNHYD